MNSRSISTAQGLAPVIFPPVVPTVTLASPGIAVAPGKVVVVPKPAHPSNYGKRTPDAVINCIVMHADASASESGTLAWFRNPAAQVSYHFLIGRDGTIYGVVPPAMKAWHAGVSVFHGVPGCNAYSIGVSFSNRNDGVEPITPAALESGVRLVAELMTAYPAITVDRITTHRIVSPGRKTDPRPEVFDLAAFQARVQAAQALHRSPGAL